MSIKEFTPQDQLQYQEERLPINSRRMRAIKQTQVLAQSLVLEYGDMLASKYRNGFSISDITRDLPEEITQRSFFVARKAVQLAIRKLLLPEERMFYQQVHFETAMQRQREEGFFKKISEKGLAVRNKDMTREEFAAMGKKGVEARGQVPWSTEEKEWALSNLEQFRSTNRVGYSFCRLSQELNRIFHNGKPVRSRYVGNAVRYFQKQAIKM